MMICNIKRTYTNHKNHQKTDKKSKNLQVIITSIWSNITNHIIQLSNQIDWCQLRKIINFEQSSNSKNYQVQKNHQLRAIIRFNNYQIRTVIRFSNYQIRESAAASNNHNWKTANSRKCISFGQSSTSGNHHLCKKNNNDIIITIYKLLISNPNSINIYTNTASYPTALKIRGNATLFDLKISRFRFNLCAIKLKV